MIKNKNFIFSMVITLFFVPCMQAKEQDLQAKKLALEVIAQLSDDLATLVINKQHKKDPQVTKDCCVRLVSTLADALATVIMKIKSNKEIRGIELLNEQEYFETLAHLSEELNNKIERI